MINKLINNKQSSLAVMLACLTLIFMATQTVFFFIHLSVTELIDALAGTAISMQFMHPVILIPLSIYLSLQLAAYILLICWIWFLAKSIEDLFKLKSTETYWLGVMLWCMACLNLLTLNNHYFPASFFSELMLETGLIKLDSMWLMTATSTILIITTLISYINFFWHRHYQKMGTMLLVIMAGITITAVHDAFFLSPAPHTATNKPNIILIGLDSLRPDFIGYFGNQTIRTPNIDNFLSGGVIYTNAYTPLARTFPAWVSILTAKHPLHSGARNNLVNPVKALAQDNLARRLQQAGYETIYATDEKRFSNITHDFGFDTILGPKMGVNDFLLSSLSDFPMNNLLASSSIGRFLFPYNYANRASAITYEPEQFLRQIKSGLANRSNKPTFLAIHLCLAHWPFSWASDELKPDDILPTKYHRSIEKVDAQLGKLLRILKDNDLLENSMVVLLSDHGTSIGLPGDRITSQQTYLGNKQLLKFITVSKLSTKSPENSPQNYTINTAYGQGTSVLSMKQYHILLAFQRFGGKLPFKTQPGLTSLNDIAPTILEFLSLPPIEHADGISLNKKLSSRPLFLETGDSFSEIETDHIYIEKVIKHKISAYKIDPISGLLKMDEPAADSIIKNKQLAILQGDWLLARFPAMLRTKLAIPKNNKQKLALEDYTLPPYFVLANLKTGAWTIGLDSPFAKHAPSEKLLKQLKEFYRDEV